MPSSTVATGAMPPDAGLTRIARMGLGAAMLLMSLAACQPQSDVSRDVPKADVPKPVPTASVPEVTAPAPEPEASTEAAAMPGATAPALNQALQAATQGLIATAAGMHALSAHCGELREPARQDALARLRQRWVGGEPDQLSGEAFESAYQAAYDETRQRIAQQPEQAKQACAELPALAQQVEQAAKAAQAMRAPQR